VRLAYRAFPEMRNLGRYRDTVGRTPNVILPKTLTEKIQRRMLFDRNPKLALFADKFRVRDYVRSKLGDDASLTKLYGSAVSAEEIRQLNLPTKFVMKPNHLSGSVKFVRDSSSLRPGELEDLARKWLGTNYFDIAQEWAYKNIRPRVIFEEFLDVDGAFPDDYKFYCFHGEPRFFLVVRDRFGDRRINYYDPSLSLLPVKLLGIDNFAGGVVDAANLGRMLEVARRLSEGVDFVRVDLYNIKGRIVFGEMTNYPNNGRGRYDPPEWDLKFGGYWK
jgi:hypothetical protein